MRVGNNSLVLLNSVRRETFNLLRSDNVSALLGTHQEDETLEGGLADNNPIVQGSEVTAA